jgi:tetratricopeptide (TPR) repeat protein
VLYRQADLPASLRMATAALDIHERRLAPDDVAVIDDLVQLARVHREISQLDEAVAALERALALAEQASGPASGRLVPVLHQLANTYRVRGQFAAARGALERAFALQAADDSVDDAKVAGLHHTLGAVCRDMRDYPAALEHLRSAVELYGRTHGEESVPQLRAEQTLSDALSASGQAAAAYEHASHVVARWRGPRRSTRPSRTTGAASGPSTTPSWSPVCCVTGSIRRHCRS